MSLIEQLVDTVAGKMPTGTYLDNYDGNQYDEYNGMTVFDLKYLKPGCFAICFWYHGKYSIVSCRLNEFNKKEFFFTKGDTGEIPDGEWAVIPFELWEDYRNYVFETYSELPKEASIGDS